MTAEPWTNVMVRYPNGQMRLVECEVRVYSSARNDVGGHQCGKPARWRLPDFDKWGDMVTCGLHKDGRSRRSTYLWSLLGNVAGEPTSIRFYIAKQRSKGATQ